MTVRERAMFRIAEFVSAVLGIAAALAWQWAMGILVALAGLGVVHLLWRVGVMDDASGPGDLVAYGDEDR